MVVDGGGYILGIGVWWWMVVGGDGYILAGSGWWWMVVDIFWLVVGGGIVSLTH